MPDANEKGTLGEYIMDKHLSQPGSHFIFLACSCGVHLWHADSPCGRCSGTSKIQAAVIYVVFHISLLSFFTLAIIVWMPNAIFCATSPVFFKSKTTLLQGSDGKMRSNMSILYVSPMASL